MSGSCTGSLLLLMLLQPCMAAIDDGPVVLITGADIGTGYELAEEYAEQGWRVIATCRDPHRATRLQALASRRANVTIEALDVRVHPQIDTLAEKYADTAIDVLINNEELGPAAVTDEFGVLDFDAFESYMETNVTAPLKIAETFLEHVAVSEQKKIITISSTDSSFANVDKPGDYFYRASKAAVNIIMVTMAPDLSERGITVGLIAPLGAVGNGHDIAATIASFSVATTSAFKGGDGRALAW